MITLERVFRLNFRDKTYELTREEVLELYEGTKALLEKNADHFVPNQTIKDILKDIIEEKQEHSIPVRDLLTIVNKRLAKQNHHKTTYRGLSKVVHNLYEVRKGTVNKDHGNYYYKGWIGIKFKDGIME